MGHDIGDCLHDPVLDRNGLGEKPTKNGAVSDGESASLS